MIGTLKRKQNIFLRIKTKNTSDIESRENFMDIYRKNIGTKLSPRKESEENNYDIVLACHPNAGDNYTLYDKIVKLVEEKEFSIYSPHRDISGNQIEFMIKEAIPNTKGVLIHFSPITEDIRILLDKTKENNKPFLIFYDQEIICDNFINKIIKSSKSYMGEIKYNSEYEAISLLEKNIDRLLEASKNN